MLDREKLRAEFREYLNEAKIKLYDRVNYAGSLVHGGKKMTGNMAGVVVKIDNNKATVENGLGQATVVDIKDLKLIKQEKISNWDGKEQSFKDIIIKIKKYNGVELFNNPDYDEDKNHIEFISKTIKTIDDFKLFLDAITLRGSELKGVTTKGGNYDKRVWIPIINGDALAEFYAKSKNGIKMKITIDNYED